MGRDYQMRTSEPRLIPSCLRVRVPVWDHRGGGSHHPRDLAGGSLATPSCSILPTLPEGLNIRVLPTSGAQAAQTPNLSDASQAMTPQPAACPGSCTTSHGTQNTRSAAGRRCNSSWGTGSLKRLSGECRFSWLFLSPHHPHICSALEVGKREDLCGC